MVRLTGTFSAVAALVTAAFAASVPSEVQKKTPFDGQYINPTPENGAVEWWWAQAMSKPTGTNPPPSFQFLFYQGYPVQVGPRDPALPQYYIVVNGFFSNGTAFALTVPAENGTVTPTGKGEELNGRWGSVGTFYNSPDLKKWNVKFTSPQLSGSVTFSSNAGNHFGCNTTSSPYFSSAVKGKTLAPTEDLLFNKLGWATTVPGGDAKVDVVINGSPLKYTGVGYHDANWAPTALNNIISTWHFGQAQVGPYDFSFTYAQPVNGTISLNTGYLSRNGVILQNQCSINGTRTKDVSYIKPYGSKTEAGVLVPGGYIIEYVLKNGETFSFNLTASGANPDRASYHRWVGKAVGGKKGSEKLEGLTVFEWLNPGLVPYNPTN